MKFDCDIEIGEEFKHEPIFEQYSRAFITPCPTPVGNNSMNAHKCPTCNKIYKIGRFLEAHIRNVCGKKSIGACDPERDSCDQLPEGDNDENNVSDDGPRKRIRFSCQRPCKCEKCCKVYKQKKHLTRHVKCAHGTAPLLSCAHCGYSTKRKQDLAKHIKRKHELSAKPHERYSCNICNKTYKWEDSLNKHSRIAHGTAPTYSCDHCGYSSKRKSHLASHIARKHGFFTSPQKPDLFCPHCSYSTKWKQYLANHIKEKHQLSSSSRERHTCTICNKTYKWKESLNRHSRMAHGNAPTFFCAHCSYSTKWKHDLGMHIKAKHDAAKSSEPHETEKPYKCESCNKTYVRREALQKHRKFECGKEPSFFCQFRDFSSKQKCDLERHVQNRHEASDATPRFKCTKCGRSYKYKRGLTKHMKYFCNE